MRPLRSFELFLSTLALATATSIVPACGIEAPPRTPLQQARDDANDGSADAVGRWLLAEMLAPGGSAKGAKDARAKLDAATGPGLDAKLAKAIDDDVHGHGGKAFDDWLDVLRAARESSASNAPLITLVAVDGATQVASLVPRAHRLEALTSLAPLVSGPSGGLGWRGAASIARLAAIAQEWGKSTTEREAIRRKAVGCVAALRIAGPFEAAPGDDDTSPLEGERPGIWPSVFEGRPNALERPRVLKTEHTGCTFAATGATGDGVYLAETFIELDHASEVVMIPNDATRVTVDDVVVHTHDATAWGGPLTDSVVVRVAAGRHRVVWRASGRAASLEVRQRDGAPIDPKGDADPTRAYGGESPPVALDDPHPALAASSVKELDPITAYLAARAALDEGAADVASVILSDLLDADAPPPAPGERPGPILELAASAAVRDPIWPVARASTRARVLYERAAQTDPELWVSPLIAIELQGEGTPPADRVKALIALSERTRERPSAALELLSIYKELGWTYEYDKLLATLGASFPDEPGILRARISSLDEHGPITEADALTEQLAIIEPDSPVVAERLLSRHEVAKAIDAYQTFLDTHPDQKSIQTRVDELKLEAGSVDDATARLAAKIANGTAASMDDADLRLARRDEHPFESAIRASIDRTGVRSTTVERALDMVQQTLDFAPYRLDAKKVIAEHDAAHQGKPAEGSAERILDYGVMWIRSDGTSQFLEHVIVRVNSREAIAGLSKVQPRTGRALHLRVLKKDGRQLEPQRVAGKPDLTFPDLEVGDAIETEVVTSGQAPASAYIAPRWYFALTKVAFARSEYVVITPKGRSLVVETRAGAPQPKTSAIDAFDVRRWRVDDAPPAPDEPEHHASDDEVVPNVTFGWGVKLEDAVARAAVALKESTPVDPRIARKALSIVATAASTGTSDRARKLYQWVIANVQKGGETDGRKVVVGGSGDHAAAFRVLARAIGIPTYITIAHDRLAPPPLSELSAGEGYRHTLLLIDTDEGPLFTAFGGRYLPFGYVPPSARGEEAIALRPGAPRMKVSVEGPVDGMKVEGTLDLSANGDAEGTITISFTGLVAANVREGIEQATEAELSQAIESHILAGELPGVRLKHFEVLGREDVDHAISLRCDVQIPSFGRASGASGKELILRVPFQHQLATIAPHPTRVTPLVIEQSDRREVLFEVTLPTGATLSRGPLKGTHAYGRDHAEVDDALDGRTLRLHRVADIEADRVEPSGYAAFRDFCSASDGLAGQETIVALHP